MQDPVFLFQGESQCQAIGSFFPNHDVPNEYETIQEAPCQVISCEDIICPIENTSAEMRSYSFPSTSKSNPILFHLGT